VQPCFTGGYFGEYFCFAAGHFPKAGSFGEMALTGTEIKRAKAKEKAY